MTHDMTLHDMTYIVRHTLSYTHTRTYTHTHIYTHTHTYTHTYIHIYRHTYVHTYIHPSIHASIHASIHSCMHADFSKQPVSYMENVAFLVFKKCVQTGWMLSFARLHYPSMTPVLTCRRTKYSRKNQKKDFQWISK